MDLATPLPAMPRALLLAAVLLGLLHHTDHVLRYDHSGWPFRPEVTGFTFSLAAYPLLGFALFARRAPGWARAAAVGVGTAATLWAHTAIETPEMQYAMWALGRSIDPAQPGVRNLLAICSPALGWAAALLSMTLNIVLVAATIGMARFAVRGG